ncbi:MAG: lipid-A-disaccharide synthase [Brachymonas sp.]
MEQETLRIGMVAGEASGDLLASLLLQGVGQHWPHWQASGIGGPRMVQQGFVAHWSSQLLAVHGYNFEVFKRVYGLWRIRRKLQERFLREKPDLFIGVDAPDFNFGLEENLRQQGIRTVHFVCPSIWAWRAHRVHTIRRSADHVLCLFPFEPALLEQHGIAATYVGHPLANVFPMEPDRKAARQQLQLPQDVEVLAVLPGSRDSEIAYLAPRFFETVRLLQQRRPKLHAVLPAAPGYFARLHDMVQAAGLEQAITVLEGQSHAALTACDVTLIASGTATLEAALLKRPMVISYAVHPLSARIMRSKQLQPWVGLPNILCRESVVPELLQEDATPPKLADAVEAWLDDPTRIAAVQRRFAALHAELQRDTATLSAQAIQHVLAR